MSPLPQLLPHTRARARARLGYWHAVLVCWGYHVRPYDMVADRRRWFWQKPTRCGAALTRAQLAAIEAWVTRMHRAD